MPNAIHNLYNTTSISLQVYITVYNNTIYLVLVNIVIVVQPQRRFVILSNFRYGG